MSGSSAAQWLEIFSRRLEHHYIELRVKGPLYAASAVFKRSVRETAWAVDASVEAALPLRKKWWTVLRAEGSFNGGLGFAVHAEKTSSRSIEWMWTSQLAASGLDAIELREGAAVAASLSADPRIPFLSSADLFFVIQDCWQPIGGAKGFFAVAGRKLYAICLEPKGPAAIVGRMAQIAPGESSTDWVSIFERSLSGEGHDFELGWDDEKRRLTWLAARAPIVGRVKIDFN